MAITYLDEEPVAGKITYLDDEVPTAGKITYLDDEQQTPGRTALNALVSGTADVAAMPFQALRNVQTTVGDIAQKYAGTPGRVFADAVTGIGANPLVSQFAAEKGGQLRQSAQENFPVDAERNPIAATVGGVVPQVGAMIGAGLALGPAAPLVLGGAMGAQGGFETADEIGVTSPEGRLATAGAFAGTEALIERFGGIGAKQAVGSAIRRGLTGAASETLEEPATGIAQDAVTRLAATEDPNNPGFTKTGYDLAQLNPSNADYWQKRKLEAIGGAVGGTMFAGVQALAGTPQEAKPPPLPETITSLQEEIKPEDITEFDEAPAGPALQPVPPVSVESDMFEAPQMEGQEYDLTPAPEAPITQPPTIKDSLSVQTSVLPEQQAAQAPQAGVEGVVKRDITKPEQQSIVEFEQSKRRPDKAPNVFFDVPTSLFQQSEGLPSIIKETAGSLQGVHRGLVSDAIEARRPVSVEAADSYGWNMPEGYTKQGDLYVYSGQGTPTPEESSVVAPIPTKATETLRSTIATFTPERQAVWTPEVIAKAQKWFETRSQDDLLQLKPSQRPYVNDALEAVDPVYARRNADAEARALRTIQQEQRREQRESKRDQLRAEREEVLNEDLNGDQTWAGNYITETQGRVSMGIDPVLMYAYIIKGADIVAKGAKNYAQFTMKMVAKYGNAVKRYLRQAWQAITTREMPKLGGGRVRVRTNEGGFVAGYGGQALPNPTPATPPPLPPEAQGPELNLGARQEFVKGVWGPSKEQMAQGMGRYTAIGNAQIKDEVNAWLDANGVEAGVEAVEKNSAAGLPNDRMQQLNAELILRLQKLATEGDGLQQMVSGGLLDRASKALYEVTNSVAGRSLQQVGAANKSLDPIESYLAAKELLFKRAKEKIEPRFEGGTTSAVTKLQDVADKSAEDAGTNLTDALEGDDTPKKPKVKAVRDATEKLTKAQRTAESILNRLADTHQDPYGWKAKGEPDPVRAFYNEHLGKPKTQAEFVSGMVALGVPEGVASTIYTAATMEIAARDEIARVIAEELAEKKRLKQEQDKTKAEDRRIEIAENRASQLIYKTEERFRQGSKDLTTAKGGDSINKVFRDEVKEPMAEEKFFSRLLALGVRRDVAERLRLTAGRERADQQAMQDLKDAEAAQAKVTIAENKASRLIYRTEEKLRQGSKDLGKSATGDSINKVFRDHIEAPMTWEAFRDRLAALNVGEAVAQRLMRTAERERTDQQAMEAFKENQKERKLVSEILAESSPKLAKMIRELRDQIAPDMTWRDIFSELPAVQKDRQKEIYRRLLLDPRLTGLNKEQRLALAIELDRAWQKEREKVFTKELEREGILGQKDKEDTKKIKQAAPRLLRLMNVGLMNSELFREAIAKEYGIKSISAEEAAILRKMGEEIQLAPEGVPREQKQEKFMRRLQDLTGATKMEILESWWTASVLSGWRTMVDIAAGISNGLEDIVAGSITTGIRTKNFDIPRKAIGAMLGNLPTAFREANYYLRTGDRSIIPSFDMQRKASLEDGTKLIGNAGRYLREQGGIKGGFGTFMEFVERVMTALDHINSSSTYEGAKMMSLARNPELWKKYMNVTKGDLDIIRQRARDELTNGKPASTKAERVAEDAQVKFLIDKMFDVDLINQAREIGREAALQGDPQGIVGKALETLTAITSKPRQVLESMEKETTGANNNRSRKLVMFALRRVAPLTKVLTGTKFVRTVGQSVNRNVSYLPGLGWVLRSGETNMTGAKQDILVAKQFIGFVVGLTLLAALRDQDDEEENLTIEGSWKGMDASKRGQRLAEGFQPNTITWRDSNGRRVSVNYMQWGLAGIFATLGAMEDQRKYFGGEKAELDILISSLTAGLMSWTDKAQLQGIQAIFSESPYSSSDVGGNMLKRLNKYASSTVGGLVPRIAKDIDAVLSPELRDSSEWWMKWAAQVPMLRELSSGKRMNIFAEDIKLDRTPFSRVVQFGTTDPAYRTLGMLNERDIWLSDPSSGIRKVKMPGGTQREMTKPEKDRYQLEVGKAYKQFIIEQGERLLSMEKKKAQEVVERRTRMIRDMAARKATMK